MRAGVGLDGGGDRVSDILDDAATLAATLKAAGVRAFTDPRAAVDQRPCVLVTPPSIDYTTRAVTWRLVCLSGDDQPTLRGWEQLDTLRQAVVEHNAVPIEGVDPAPYSIGSERPPIPALLLRCTTSI